MRLTTGLEDSILDDDLKRIATRIRAWRDEAGLTLQQLGDRSGVSASTIHKIENLQTVPTIAVLLKVAHGLNRRPSELLAEVDVGRQVAVMRRDDRRTFSTRDRGAIEHLVGTIPRNRLDVWRLRCEAGVGAGAGDAQPWQFQGEVVLIVEEGVIEAEIGGALYEIGPGDSIHFDASLPHRWVAGGEKPAQAVILGAFPQRVRGDLFERLAEAIGVTELSVAESEARLA